jgi:hypothetical protein
MVTVEPKFLDANAVSKDLTVEYDTELPYPFRILVN